MEQLKPILNKPEEEKELDIFEFMKENNLILSNNEIFLEIWTPLYNKKEILITENLLQFMGFINNLTRPQKRDASDIRTIFDQYIAFLSENNIIYEHIEYLNPKAKYFKDIENYIQNQSNLRTLHSKRWLILSIDSFKNSIMMLNNTKANEVKNYYSNLEKIFYSYLEYIKDYHINIERIRSLNLQKKNQELQEENNQLKVTNFIINNFVDNVKSKYKNGYIYIATTGEYARKNIFKIGKTDNLKTRLATYNSGRIEDDLLYYCFFEKVYNINKVENFINNLLEDFKEKRNKENFVLHYTYLEPLVKLVIKNINEPYKYINDLIRNKLLNIYSLKPVIPVSIEIDERGLFIKELENIVISTINEFIKENKFNITRKEIIERINNNHQEIIKNKSEWWKNIKSILKWQSNNSPITFKKFELMIKY
jgi:hypothetical protein